MQPEDKRRNFPRLVKLFSILIVIVAISGIGFLLYHNVSKVSATRLTDQSTLHNTAQPVQINPPLSKQQINKIFTFPVKDAEGQTITSLSYVIQSAELDNQIIVKGQPASAVEGRVFLIFNLKLTNASDKDIQINTRDYLRLSVNGNDTDRLAPEIYNDPVDVQAISTKYTRVGFAINTTDKNLKLYVGEISGTKTPITLNLH